MKRSDPQIFGASWLGSARSASDVASWASEVIADYDTTGKTYLDTIRQWFDGFSAEPRDKNKLRGELENFSKNSAHVAGVNELAWWTLMKAQGMLAAVVPTTKSAARPDFDVHSPFECYIEVTTLNVSQADETAFAEAPALMEDAKSRPDDEEDEDSVSKHIGAALDRNETIRRLIWNSARGKLNQLKHATDQKKPAVLVVFDYTAFSAYATDFNRALGDSLLGVKKNLQTALPNCRHWCT